MNFCCSVEFETVVDENAILPQGVAMLNATLFETLIEIGLLRAAVSALNESQSEAFNNGNSSEFWMKTLDVLNSSVSELAMETDTIKSILSNLNLTTSVQSSMVAGWPDAIACTGNVSGHSVHYLVHGPTNNGAFYYRFTVNGEDTNGPNRDFKYYSNGTFWRKTGNIGASDCDGKSIQQLYDDGLAFNFVGSNDISSLSVERLNVLNASLIAVEIEMSDIRTSISVLNESQLVATSMIEGWPDAIKCFGDGTTGMVMFYHVVPTRYRFVSNSETIWDFKFNADGTFAGKVGNMGDTDCDDKSISELYASNSAFNFAVR